MESEEFMLLPANQLIDIISSDELNVRSEEQVFNAVMAWVKYSIQERRPQLPQVCGWWSLLQQLLLLSPVLFLAYDPVTALNVTSDLCSGTDEGFHMSFRCCSMSGCRCSAPSSWWAPSGQTLSLKVTRSAGGFVCQHFSVCVWLENSAGLDPTILWIPLNCQTRFFYLFFLNLKPQILKGEAFPSTSYIVLYISYTCFSVVSETWSMKLRITCCCRRRGRWCRAPEPGRGNPSAVERSSSQVSTC